MSLDNGIFEDFHLMTPPPTECPVHFAGAVDEGVGSPFLRREFSNQDAGELIIDHDLPVCSSGLTPQHDIETSVTTCVTNIRVHLLAPHVH